MTQFKILPTKGERAQALRLWTGLVLFAFAFTHFLNHALGIISLDVMEQAQSIRKGFWRFPPLSILLYASLLVHIGLGIWKTVSRNTLLLRRWEWVQLLLGLFIPYSLISHIIGTRALRQVFEISDDYTFVLGLLWPGGTLSISLLLLAVWIHSVIGLHFYLRERLWYKRALTGLMIGAVLLPVLSLWGWIEAARRLALRGDKPKTPLLAEHADWAGIVIGWLLNTFLGLLVFAAIILACRLIYQRLQRKVSIDYGAGRVVRSARGASVLEISRANNIDHMSVCGGRARCSTCRVRILKGLDKVEAANDHEAAVLKRVGAGENVRLACQLRPHHDLTIRQIMSGKGGGAKRAKDTLGEDSYQWGVEQDVAVMFVDIRGFTTLSEDKLSYDVVFLLNQYFDRMSACITGAGGYVDKYIGDGIMAMFGMKSGVKQGSKQALEAAMAMEQALAELNEELSQDLEAPLRIGIGIHAGSAILGRIGVVEGTAGGVTALGDTVNTASRLEGACKDLKVMLVVSHTVWHHADMIDAPQFEYALSVRGRNEPLTVMRLERPSDMKALQMEPFQAK